MSDLAPHALRVNKADHGLTGNWLIYCIACGYATYAMDREAITRWWRIHMDQVNRGEWRTDDLLTAEQVAQENNLELTP